VGSAKVARVADTTFCRLLAVDISTNTPRHYTNLLQSYGILETGLVLPRSVAFLPNGGCYISEHSPGDRIWYVDPENRIHVWLNGSDNNNYRVGDGQWFCADPTLPEVSRVRSVIPDPFGLLIIVESNCGYVWRISFQRIHP
jgi:hypothetical protein